MASFSIRLSLPFIIIAGGFFAFTPSDAHAATLHFNFGASVASPNGSASRPYTTPAHFTANVSGGDTVNVTGSLSETLGVGSKSGTASQPTVIQAWSGRSQLTINSTSGGGIDIYQSNYVQLSGVSTNSSNAHGLYIHDSANVTVTDVTTTSGAGAGIFAQNADTLTIANVTITSPFGSGISVNNGSINGSVSNTTITNAGGQAIVIDDSGGTVTGGNTGWTIDNVTITSPGQEGISCSADSDNLTITDTTITGAGRTSAKSSIYLRICDNTVVRGNTLSGGSSQGVEVINSPGTVIDRNSISTHSASGKYGVTLWTSTNTVTSNLFNNNANGILIGGSGGTLSGNVIANNTFYKGTISGFATTASTGTTITDLTFANNIVSTGDSSTVMSTTGTAPSISSNFDYNVYLLNGTSTMRSDAATLADWKALQTGDQNSIADNPLFTNADGGDFTLQAGSPAVDAGNPSVSFTSTDYLGETRPWTSATGRADAGAYEKRDFLSSTGVTLSGTPVADGIDHSVTLSITDATNGAGTSYAITTDGGTTWLDGNGDVSTTPVYSSETTWTHAGLAKLTAYTYRLRISYGEAGGTTVALLDPITVTTLDDTIYDPPTTLTAPSESAGTLGRDSATLTWETVADATGYKVSWGTDAAATNGGTVELDEHGEVAAASHESTVSTALSGLNPDRTYYWMVSSDGPAGYGDYSDVSSFTTLPHTSLGLLLTPGVRASSNLRVVDAEGEQVLNMFAFWPLRVQVKAMSGDVDGDGWLDIAAGAVDSLAGGDVRFFDRDGEYMNHVMPFGAAYRGGVDYTLADVNGDGDAELIVIPRIGRSNLRVYDLNTEEDAWELLDWAFVFGSSFTGGSVVAAGDTDGDGRAEIAIHPRIGSSNLQLYRVNTDNELTRVTWLAPYGASHVGGVEMLLTDYDGDEKAELVMIPQHGVSQLRIYNLNDDEASLTVDQVVYTTPTVMGSYTLASGDVNGDGVNDLAVVPKAGNGALVKVLKYDETLGVRLQAEQLVFAASHRAGTNITVHDIDEDGTSEVIVGSAAGNPNTRIYDFSTATPELETWFWAFRSGFSGGVSVSH